MAPKTMLSDSICISAFRRWLANKQRQNVLASASIEYTVPRGHPTCYTEASLCNALLMIRLQVSRTLGYFAFSLAVNCCVCSEAFFSNFGHVAIPLRMSSTLSAIYKGAIACRLDGFAVSEFQEKVKRSLHYCKQTRECIVRSFSAKSPITIFCFMFSIVPTIDTTHMHNRWRFMSRSRHIRCSI